LLGVAECPNLVALNSLARQAANFLIVVGGARGAKIGEQLDDGVF
jgi:hypothetical protein